MWASYDVDMVAGEEHEFCLDVELAENADNNFMGDGVSLGLNFLLSQK
jgi:hypothetical protein